MSLYGIFMEEISQHVGMDYLPHYVMKVLSGSMYGVDIPLPHSENVHVRFMSLRNKVNSSLFLAASTPLSSQPPKSRVPAFCCRS